MRTLDDDEKAAARMAYRAGEPLSSIADRLGVDLQALRQIVAGEVVENQASVDMSRHYRRRVGKAR